MPHLPLGLVVAIVALKPAFLAERDGKRAMVLAMWTARKDYFEFCEQHGWQTTAGCNATDAEPPGPPPAIDPRFVDSMLSIGHRNPVVSTFREVHVFILAAVVATVSFRLRRLFPAPAKPTRGETRHFDIVPIILTFPVEEFSPCGSESPLQDDVSSVTTSISRWRPLSPSQWTLRNRRPAQRPLEEELTYVSAGGRRLLLFPLFVRVYWRGATRHFLMER
ncbi:hypothetical protein B0T19DRAFT_398802 [Cercophora scortea]|uniref:Uncharacterized protein n=1 Tax=Cercophora scortea TaxID=314031 RepID=A0AAE0MI54_9PEZI|nr:hypothetical protein B0T19DRAFT_398802 [Cercophora scortea]